MKIRLALAVCLLAAACAHQPTDTSAPAAYAPAPDAAVVPVVEVLTDGDGMTLYIFDRDVAASGKSACNGPCAANWIPQPAADDATPFGSYTVVTRDDGSKQWAYKGKPLYRWSKDRKAGDRMGDNVNDVWHVATP
jgi:predicted lipoprotein with Yx(FWY)xxD motif